MPNIATYWQDGDMQGLAEVFMGRRHGLSSTGWDGSRDTTHMSGANAQQLMAEVLDALKTALGGADGSGGGGGGEAGSGATCHSVCENPEPPAVGVGSFSEPASGCEALFNVQQTAANAEATVGVDGGVDQAAAEGTVLQSGVYWINTFDMLPTPGSAVQDDAGPFKVRGLGGGREGGEEMGEKRGVVGEVWREE